MSSYFSKKLERLKQNADRAAAAYVTAVQAHTEHTKDISEDSFVGKAVHYYVEECRLKFQVAAVQFVEEKEGKDWETLR